MFEIISKLKREFKLMKKKDKIDSLKRAIYLTLILQVITIYITYTNKLSDHFHSIKKGDEISYQIEVVKSKFTFDSLTDYDNLKMLNKMLKTTIEILEKNGLVYWIIGGTLLGAIRDKGLVQWDDDADLCLMQYDLKKFLQLESQFKKANISILNYKRLGFFKLYNSNGKNFVDSDGVMSKYPFIDIFFFRQTNQHLYQHVIKYENKIVKFLKKNFARTNIFNYNDVFPLKKYEFEDYEINGPKNPYEYLDRVYPYWKSSVKIHRHFKKENQNNKKFSINYDNSKKPHLWIYFNQSIQSNNLKIIENYHSIYSDSFEIEIINSKNILNYLPEIAPIHSRLSLTKFSREIYEIILLYKYGGIFIDSSVVFTLDLKKVIDKLRKYYFIGFGCELDAPSCYGKPSTTLILASRPKNVLIENILKRIFSKLNEYLLLDEMPFKIIIWDELNKLIKKYNYEYYHYYSRMLYYKYKDDNSYLTNIFVESGSNLIQIVN